ncbi:MAG: hypothetical protein ABIV06_06900, partial [Thermoanaerobaculia bacterium]
MSKCRLISAALVLLAAGVTASPSGAASTQLSEGQAFSDINFGTTAPKISPNGQYAVYRQDADTDSAIELWSVALSGVGSPVRLSDILVPTPGQFMTFAISPDSSRVVYLVDQDTVGQLELYSVPIGGGVATKLNPALAPNRDVIRFQISTTSDRVYYTADALTTLRYELFGVSIDGGSSTKLSAPLQIDNNVEEIAVSPDGQTVVYLAGRSGNRYELFSVPADGGEVEKISTPLSTSGAVDSYFQISPNGQRVVYIADDEVDESYDLYSVAIGGGTSTKLNGALVTRASVDPNFLISADSSRVIYRADQTNLFTYNLYSAPLAGGSPAVQLNGLLAPGEDVETGFLIQPGSAKVVYRSDEDQSDVIEVYSVPIGGGLPIRLNSTLTPGGDVLEAAISPNGARVVYRADQSVDTLNELWSVPIGGGTVARLNRTLASGGDVQNFRIGASSAWVVYGADQDDDGVDELLRVPLAGGAVENVSSHLAPGGDVVVAVAGTPAYEISPVNSYDVLYAADELVNDEVELFLSGPPEAEPDDCTPDATTLCLQNDKFNVSVTWRDFQDRSGTGKASGLSNESGDFWFFNAQSNELIVKIIDGCSSTGSYWVFWRALSNVEIDLVIRNTATLQTLTYHNPLGYNSNGHLDIETIFHCDGSGPASESIDTRLDLPAPGAPQRIEREDPLLIGACVPDGDRAICLQNGRFKVEGTWSDFSGGNGRAHLIKKNEG